MGRIIRIDAVLPIQMPTCQSRIESLLWDKYRGDIHVNDNEKEWVGFYPVHYWYFLCSQGGIENYLLHLIPELGQLHCIASGSRPTAVSRTSQAESPGLCAFPTFPLPCSLSLFSFPSSFSTSVLGTCPLELPQPFHPWHLMGEGSHWYKVGAPQLCPWLPHAPPGRSPAALATSLSVKPKYPTRTVWRREGLICSTVSVDSAHG